MRNRKQRYDQRTDKYQEQERVPECLSKDVYDAPIYGEDKEYSREDYYDSCGDSECGICISRRYAELDKDTVPLDWMSVDSAEDEHETNNYLLSLAEAEHAQRNKEPTSLDKAGDKQEPVIRLNRYALLNEEAETSSDEQGPQTCSNPEEEEDNLNGKTVEDESDWNVVRYRSSKDVSNVLKQMKIHKRRMAAARAYNKSTLFYNPAKIQKWIDSWCNDKRVRAIGSGDETLIISTDGLFRENRKAGYGVLVRSSRSGVPLVGSAGVYTRGKPVSAFYHELQGINRGLELAIKYGLGNEVKVYCNSCLAAHLLSQSRFGCFCGDEYNNFRLGIVCKRCTKRYTSESSEEDFQTLIYPLIREIMEKFSMYSFKVYAVQRKRNRAADHLAKLQLQKEEMEPHEFPEELKAILYEDAKGGHVMAPSVWRERAWW